MDYPELKISFHSGDKRDERRYDVRLDLTVPGAVPGESPKSFWGPFPVEFDWDELEKLPFAVLASGTSDEYGKALSKAFFRDSRLKEKFALSRAYAAEYDALRVRMCLAPETRRLHDVPWERLQDPETGARLSTDEHVLISRFLAGGEAQPVRLHPKTALRALVMIANPRGLDNAQVERRDLAPVDVDAEWKRAAASLKSIGIVKLAAPEVRASLDNLVEQLREGFDVLYLVCHGALVEQEDAPLKRKSLLFLENERGDIDRVPGSKLTARLKEMHDPPRLVVLASCQSAGCGGDARSDDRGALAALAPRIAEAGVPAVIAMQSNIRMTTASMFFPTFFKELLRDGQIDRAVAVARATIGDCADWWVPVLITQLQLGRIWSEHGGDGRGARHDQPMQDRQKDGALDRELETSSTQNLLDNGLAAGLAPQPIKQQRGADCVGS